MSEILILKTPLYLFCEVFLILLLPHPSSSSPSYSQSLDWYLSVVRLESVYIFRLTKLYLELFSNSWVKVPDLFLFRVKSGCSFAFFMSSSFFDRSLVRACPKFNGKASYSFTITFSSSSGSNEFVFWDWDSCKFSSMDVKSSLALFNLLFKCRRMSWL